MKPHNSTDSKFFISLLLLATVLQIPGILDLAMVPRFIFASAALCIFAFKLYTNPPSQKINVDIIVLTYFLFVVFSTASIFWAQTKSESIFDNAKLWMSFLIFTGVYYYLKNNGNTFIQKLLKIVIIASLLSIAFAVIQLTGLPNLKKESIYLVTGLNSHKNLVSSFLLLMFAPLFLGFKKLDSMWKILSVIALIASLILIAILRTKAVWAGLAVALMIYGLILLSKKIKFTVHPFLSTTIALLVANLFFIFLLPQIINKSIDTIPERTTTGVISHGNLDEERLVVWHKTYTIASKKLLTGYGAGNWQIQFPDATLTGLWRVEDLNVTFQRPHNDFLWILSETGIPGLNLFLIFLLLLFFYGVKSYKSGSTNSILYLSIISGFYVAAFFDFPKERTEHLIWLNCLMALLYFDIKNNVTLKPVLQIQLKKTHLFLGLVFLCFLLLIGILRFKGEYYTRLMYDYKNSARFTEVIKSGNSALSFVYSLDPTSVPVQWYTGNAQASLGNYEYAQKDFETALKFNPYNRNVLNDLASAYVFNNRINEAIKLYEEAARISPRFDEPKLNLAAIFIKKGEFGTASFWLNSLLHNSERRTKYQIMVDIGLQNQKLNEVK